MHRLTISRILVEDANVAEWEEAIAKQVEIASAEPGTLLYGFVRRGSEGSTMLAQPRAGFVDYIQIHAYADEASFASHVSAEADWWKPTSERLAPHANRVSERFEDTNYAAVVSRDHLWKPDTMLNLGILRFKVPIDDAPNFEVDARRQIGMVTENELGTVLYAFVRRTHAASGLFPKPIEANAEYVSFSAYVDADARKLHGEIEHRGEINLAGDHFTFDGDWAWGTAYRSHLASPLESEPLPASQIIAVTSRFAVS